MSIKTTALRAVGGLALFLAALPFAEAKASKWGMAGCGVGALIFEEQPGKVQILAATTNQYFLQSSSITSGTTGCKDSPREVAALFITINGESLKKDISRGGGETLSGLARIYDCEKADDFGVVLQKSFSEVYPSESVRSEEVRTRIEGILMQNQLACKALS